MSIPVTFAATSLTDVADEFRRRAQSDKTQATRTKSAARKSELEASARVWEEAASILDNTTLENKQ